MKIERIDKPTGYYPVMHTCGHYEARLCRYRSSEGFLRARNSCTQCDAQGRPLQESFQTIEAVSEHCDARNADRRVRNVYEIRQDPRRERLATGAQKVRGEARAAFHSADAMAEVIPFGQPILVGHHSEKRDRRYRDRISGKMREGIELSRKAEDLDRRADRVGTGGISSDDPDAVEKLLGEVALLEHKQELMKKANRCVKRSDRAGLAELGFDEREIAQLFTPDWCGRTGFSSFALSNNNANIRRIKQRINDLERRAATPAIAAIAGDGWTIREDVDDNRVLIVFDEKPPREMLAKLKTGGFRWSPTRGAHVRMRSNGAIYAAKRVVGLAS